MHTAYFYNYTVHKKKKVDFRKKQKKNTFINSISLNNNLPFGFL